jgi:putative acetyltransferase
MTLTIKEDDLSGPEIQALLRTHLQNMVAITPPESMHALDLTRLRQPEVTFWSAWTKGELAGCGALKQLDAQHAEIKSMRTVAPKLRNGVATYVLQHIIAEAKRRGVERLSLETGAAEPFAPARTLYAKFGFRACGPFGDYVEDSNSVFMTLEL